MAAGSIITSLGASNDTAVLASRGRHSLYRNETSLMTEGIATGYSLVIVAVILLALEVFLPTTDKWFFPAIVLLSGSGLLLGIAVTLLTDCG